MADFDLSFDKLMRLEFSSPKNALHKNKGENGLTFMGIYERANPNWSGWQKIYQILGIKNPPSLEYYSEICYQDKDLQDSVREFYKKEYWDKARLDFVLPFDIANLIFIFGVNVGMKKAIKYAQQIVGVENDGIVGKNTLNALNSYSPLRFVRDYKHLQIKYYTQLALANKERYVAFLNGWINRVKKT